MKKLVIFLAVGIILAGCSPTDKQIQDAIEMTEAAMPTGTPTPLPTSTEAPTPTITLIPTVTTSPTPDVPHIQGLSRQDVLLMFLNNGFTCGEWELNEKGNYAQSCVSSALSGIPDSIIMASISGRSEDTIFGYYIVFTPYKTFESWVDLEVLLKKMVDFGKEPEENIVWFNEYFVHIKNSEDVAETREYYDTNLILASVSGVISLMIVSSD